MAKLNQIQLRFDPLEDRLLMRMNTTDNAEVRLWLTRRFVKVLWPILQKMMEGDVQVSQQIDRQAKDAVLAFQQEKAAATTDFATPYKEEAEKVILGEEPILLSKIQLRKGQQGTQMLSLYPETGEGVNLSLDSNLLHSFSRLLQDGVKKAEWMLEMNITDEPAVVLAPPPANVRLN